MRGTKKRIGKKILCACGLVCMLQLLTPSVPEVHAADYTITAANMVLYSNEGTVVYAQADFASQIITVMNGDLPVQVTGMTSNGWYQITTGMAIYYIPANGLHSKDQASVNMDTQNKITVEESLESRIKKMTKGTFSFYSKIQLDSFSQEELEEMSANEYIKYLDSFLVGKSDPSKAIKLDTGLTAGKEFTTKNILHAKMTAKNVTEYLIEYRNNYLQNSFWGPVDTIEDVKVCINRAIRYDIASFATVCKEYELKGNEIKFRNRINKILEQIKDEQGIDFKAEYSYGEYTDNNGNRSSGFILQIERKIK